MTAAHYLALGESSIHSSSLSSEQLILLLYAFCWNKEYGRFLSFKFTRDYFSVVIID